MDSIRIKNLRSIVDSGEIHLSNINILLGKNSSGKSSFLRLFPLLKETSRHELRAPILWFDENYDFGDFKNTLSRHATDGKDTISLSFSWKVQKSSIVNYYYMMSSFVDGAKKDEELELSVDIGISSSNEKTIFKYLKVKMQNYNIVFEYVSPSKPIKLTINDREILNGNYTWSYGNTGILPGLRNMSKVSGVEPLLSALTNIYGVDKIKMDAYYSLNGLVNFDDESVWNFISTAFLASKEKKVKKNIKDSADYRNALDAAIWLCMGWVLRRVDEGLSSYFGHSYYITPLRYNFQRYMRNRDLAVDYVESTGKNVMEYIVSLNDVERESYIKFISDTLDIKVDVEGDINKSIFIEMKDGERDNIVDVGYGYSQVLPIATTLWDRVYKKESRYRDGTENTIVIEQPEVHLHPAMQKKLAKLFVGALALAKSRDKILTLIIETHSQSLVNQLGKYVANSMLPEVEELQEIYKMDMEKDDTKISANEISLFLFEKKDGITTVTQTQFGKDGIIERWPLGFLD
jgi:predicted ATPase